MYSMAMSEINEIILKLYLLRMVLVHWRGGWWEIGPKIFFIILVFYFDDHIK